MSNSVALRGYGARNSAAVAGYAVLQAPQVPVEPPDERRRRGRPKMWVRVPQKLVWRATLVLKLVGREDLGPDTPPAGTKRPRKASLGPPLAKRRKTVQKRSQTVRLRLKTRREGVISTKTEIIIRRPAKAALSASLRLRKEASTAAKLRLTVRRPSAKAAVLALTRYYGLSTAELACLLAVEPAD